jgi:PAS domain S-box-containing protein
VSVGYLDRRPDSDALFRSLFEGSPLGLALTGQDGRIKRVNPAFATMLGRAAPELLGRHFTELTHPDDRSAAGLDKRFVRPDGTVVRARVSLTTVPGPDGARDRLVQCEDITGRMLAEEQAAREQDLLARATEAVKALQQERTAALAALDRLARSERRFAEVFEHSPVPKMVVGLRGDDRGRVLLANPAFRDLLGDPAAQVSGVDLPALALAAEPAREARLRRADGSLVTVSVHVHAITDDQGPQSAVVQLLDVTAERSARADLARSEEQFRTAFDGCPIGLLIADEHGRFQRANPAAAHLTGRTREELAGLTHRDITDPADIEATARARLALLRGAGEVTYDNRLARPDGTLAWTRVTLSLIPGPAGRRWRLVQLQDITAERAAAAGRERELSRLRATLAVQREVTAAAGVRDDALRVVADRAVDLFDAADGSALELVDGDVLYYQATAGTLAGAAGVRIRIAGSLSGRVLTTDAPAHCPDTAGDPRVDRAACERLGIGSMLIAPLHAENRVIGCLKISAARSHVFDETDEQQLALLADSLSSALRHADDAERNAELLAERTRALAALEASETRFRLAFDNSPLGISLIGMTEPGAGRYLQVNPAMTAITGYPADELTRMTYKDLIVPEDLPSDEEVRAAVTANGAYRQEMRYRHKDGHAVWVSLRGAPVHDRQGRALYLVNQVEDITEKRAADAELRRHARLLALIPAAVIVRDPDGTIRWWNAGAETLYGWPQSAVDGKNVHRLLSTRLPGGGRPADVAHSLERDGHWDGQLEHVTADGRTVTVLSRQVLHRPRAGADPQVLEINTDVTAARAAEKALAESEQKFRAQFANSAAGQIIRSLDGSHVQVNPAYAAMLGYTPEELIRVPEEQIVHPDDLADAQREIAARYAGNEAAYTHEGKLRHRDGHWVDVAATVSLVRDETGRPKNLIAVVTDISARRAAEMARDQAAAALADRNRELEAANQLKLDLIGMLGHEIGNPLSSIRGYAELLTEGLDGPQRERAVDTIGRQAARLDEIVREVLAMVSLDAGAITASRQEFWLRAEVTRALATMDLDHLPVAGPDVRVRFNAGHLQQIMVNLLSNAAKYGGGATAIKIDSRGTGTAHVTVEDNGPGVPGEFQPRLFERMARADRDAASVRGTGLGLYIVRGLAQANHGEIHHEPNPAGGSRFILALEAAPAACG